MILQLGALLASFLAFCLAVIAVVYLGARLLLWIRGPYREHAYRPLVRGGNAAPGWPLVTRRLLHTVLVVSLPLVVPFVLVALAWWAGQVHPGIVLAAAFVGVISAVPSLLIVAPKDHPLRAVVFLAFVPAMLAVQWMAVSVYAMAMLAMYK